MAENQVATRGNQAPSSKVLSLITGDYAKKQFAMALPKHISPELLMRICLTAINKVPKLAECTQETLFACILDLAQMGLVPDGRNAYLIPRWNGRKGAMECTFIVGYQGFIELAYRHPLVKGIRFNAVYAKDFFEYEDGLESKLVHRQSEEDDPGPLTHAWAVCELEGGGRTFVVIGKRDVKTAMKMQPDSDKPYSPWQQHAAAMWQKTAVRALSKRMPRSAELMAALEADDKQANAAAIDVTSMTIPAAALGAGIGASALQDATGNAGGGPPADEDTGGNGAGNEDPNSGSAGGNQDEQPNEVKKEPAGNQTKTKGPTLAENRGWIVKKLSAMNIGRPRFVQALEEMEIIPRVVPFDDLALETLQDVIDRWDELKGKIPPQ